MKDIVNTLEEPLTDVIALEIFPPVQDSATANFIFFFMSRLTILVFIDAN